jgi:hypothetical protein
MKSMLTTTLALVVAGTLIIGCDTADEAASTPDTASVPITGAAFLLDAEPDGAQPVIAAREAAQDGEEVVVLGRIGGDASPWTSGRAAFKIVDPSLKACSDIPGDACATPWDYCCEVTGLPAATALVKVVDEQGNLIKEDAKRLLGVKELDTVVVRGKASRDDAGNLTVLATGIHVKK